MSAPQTACRASNKRHLSTQNPCVASCALVLPPVAGRLVQVAMLWPAQQLKECQSAQLEADAGSQAYWLQQYSRDTLAQLPGSADDAFGGQTVTQERLGERGTPSPAETLSFSHTHTQFDLTLASVRRVLCLCLLHTNTPTARLTLTAPSLLPPHPPPSSPTHQPHTQAGRSRCRCLAPLASSGWAATRWHPS